MKATVDWRGSNVEAECVKILGGALTEIGLRIEAQAKRQLYKGHGVITGTLRRSIHTSDLSYNWPGDDVRPSNGSPERGGAKAEPSLEGAILWLAIGSGLVYAMPVHQGHGSFTGYHYLTNALEQVRPDVAGIIAKHKKK